MYTQIQKTNLSYVPGGGNDKGLEVIDYTDKAIVVKDTKGAYANELIKMGGLYRENYRCGPGYMFPKKQRNRVDTFISTGTVVESPYSQASKMTQMSQYQLNPSQSFQQPQSFQTPQQSFYNQPQRVSSFTQPSTVPQMGQGSQGLQTPGVPMSQLDYIEACLEKIMTVMNITPPAKNKVFSSEGLSKLLSSPQDVRVQPLHPLQGVHPSPQSTYQTPTQGVFTPTPTVTRQDSFQPDGDDNTPDGGDEDFTDDKLPSLKHKGK